MGRARVVWDRTTLVLKGMLVEVLSGMVVGRCKERRVSTFLSSLMPDSKNSFVLLHFLRTSADAVLN